MTDGGAHQAGDLAIDAALQDTLSELRARGGVSGRAEVDLDQLHAVEAAFAITFADDLLATFAAAVPALIERFRFELSMVVGHTGALQTRGARGDLVGVGHDKTADLFYCVEKSNATTTTLVVFNPDGKTMTRLPLAQWLAQRIDELPPPATTAGELTPKLGELTPKLVREMPGAPSGRRARHKKFGEGRVLREIGTGPQRKVQVAFPNLGLKLLQARFLEFLDD